MKKPKQLGFFNSHTYESDTQSRLAHLEPIKFSCSQSIEKRTIDTTKKSVKSLIIRVTP